MKYGKTGKPLCGLRDGSTAPERAEVVEERANCFERVQKSD